MIVATFVTVLLVCAVPVAATGQASPRSAAAVLDQFSSGRLEPAAAESRAACERPDARADSIQTGLLALRSLTAEQEAMLIAAWSDFAGACRNAAVTAWLIERLERPTNPMQRLVVVRGMGVTERGRETVLRVIAQMDMTEPEMESLTDLAFSTVRPGTAVAELAAGYERHGIIASGVLALRLAGARAQGIDVTEAMRRLLRTIENRPGLAGADRVFMALDNDARLDGPGFQEWRADFERAARRFALMDRSTAPALVRAAQVSQEARQRKH
jgi:hypothetical protein